MSQELLNDNQIHAVMIKLDREKERELKFRQFLDYNVTRGMNRKETMLQLFEESIKNKEAVESSEEASNQEEKEKEEKNDMKIVKLNEDVDISDFELI